jgi:hypothetical protein
VAIYFALDDPGWFSAQLLNQPTPEIRGAGSYRSDDCRFSNQPESTRIPIQSLCSRISRMAAHIIHDDVGFMKTNRPVFRSSELFDHHLADYEINNKSLTLLHPTNPPESIQPLLDNTEFYYLEYIPYEQ